MGNFFAAVGRSNLNETMAGLRREGLEQRRLNMIERQQNENIGIERQRLAMDESAHKATMDFQKAQTEQIANKTKYEQQMWEEGQKLNDVDTFLDNVTGGREGPHAQYMLRVAKQYGLVSPDNKIKTIDLIRSHEILSKQEHVQKLADIEYEYQKSNYDKLIKARNDPKFAKENNIDLKTLPQQLEQAVEKVNMAVRNNDAIQKHFKAESERMKAEADLIAAKRARASYTTKTQVWINDNGDKVTLKQGEIPEGEGWNKVMAVNPNKKTSAADDMDNALGVTENTPANTTVPKGRTEGQQEGAYKIGQKVEGMLNGKKVVRIYRGLDRNGKMIWGQ